MKEINDSIIKSQVLVNYNSKTHYMIDNFMSQDDINSMISLLNYCFLTKNEFFINTFNHKMINNVYMAYNRMKTNILEPEINDIYHNIKPKDMKLLRFIMNNFVSIYNNISDTDIITKYITRESIINVSKSINSRMQLQ